MLGKYTCHIRFPVNISCKEAERTAAGAAAGKGGGMGMDNTIGIVMIGAACLLVLLVAAMRSRTQILLNFILRAVLGLLIIYFVDSFLDGRGIPVHVGLGAVSLVMSGLLGAPGVLLLYGIGVCAWLLG